MIVCERCLVNDCVCALFSAASESVCALSLVASDGVCALCRSE